MVDRYDEELFLEYVEGELPVEKRVAFENQMLQDPRLRNLVAQMVLDRHRMRTMPDETPPDHLMDAVHERLERAMLLGASPQEFAQNKPLASKGFRWRRFATMGAMAAMVAVVAGVFVVTLVQLANDTPIRNVGPGSLFPPGMLPPSLVPAKPNIAGTSPSADANPSDAANPSSDTTPDLSITQPTQPTLALVPPTLPNVNPVVKPVVKPGVKPDLTTPVPLQPPAQSEQLPPPPLPEASLVFSVTAQDIPAASRRLTAWITAYQATQLDIRPFDVAAGNRKANNKTPDDSIDVSESTDKPAVGVKDDKPAEAAPTANQAITLDDDASQTPAVSTPAVLPGTSPRVTAQASPQVTPPAAQPGLMVTLALPDEQLMSLEMFLTTLPDAQVNKAEAGAPPVQPAVKPQALPYVLADRADSLPAPREEATDTTAPLAAQQWLGSILPDWLLDPETPLPAGHAGQSPTQVPAGQTIVRVEFIPG